MLNTKELRDNMIATLNTTSGFESITFEPVDVCKMNDIMLHGVICRKDGSDGSESAPAVYAENYTEEYENGGIAAVVDAIKETLYSSEGNRPTVKFDFTFDMVYDKLTIRLVGSDLNSKWLEDKPHKDLFDGLSAVVDIDFGGGYLTTITNAVMESLGCDFAKLLETATLNDLASKKPILSTMFSAMMGCGASENLLDGASADANEGMYVLQNDGAFGASAILHSAMMIHNAIGDFYALPSSVHEWIIIPDNGCGNIEEYKGIVESANKSVVAPNEVLSYGVWHSDTEKMLVRVA